MNQQVNLYKDEFRPRRIALSLNQMFILWGSLLLVCAGISYLIYGELEDKRQVLDSTQAQVDDITARIAELDSKIQTRRLDTSLEDANERLQQQLLQQENLLEALASGRLTEQEQLSVAAVLTGLAHVPLKGLWLDHIRLAEGGQLALQGRARTADLVPEYLKKLGEQNAFRGRQFSSFVLAKDETTGLVRFNIGPRSESGEDNMSGITGITRSAAP